MKFALTDSQRALRNEVRDFARKKIRPRAIELDHNEKYPIEILEELGERRFTGLTLPEEYRGRDGGLIE